MSVSPRSRVWLFLFVVCANIKASYTAAVSPLFFTVKMEQQYLDITIISATGIKDVCLFSKMNPYVVASVFGDPLQPNQEIRSPVDFEGGINPIWNFPAKFTICEAPAHQNRLKLVFQLRCDRTLGDRDIGEVNVPIKELLDSMGDGKSMQFVSYQVQRPSGKLQGELNFSFKFTDKVVSSEIVHMVEEPVTAPPPPPPFVGHGAPPYGTVPGSYPPPPPVMAPVYGYPPPSAYAGYPLTPQGFGIPAPSPGYGYPPGQAGYGYPPMLQQAQNQNTIGMGLAGGFIGRTLGGLLIGDMLSDGASNGASDGAFDGAFGI